MSGHASETVDPRIRRTRHLLQQGLSKLLEEKDFDRISVHEIADAATINRATFYDHYEDKYALLECMVAGRFHKLLVERQLHFDGSCPSALRSLILTLCIYLIQMQEIDTRRPFQPHMESAVIAVIRRILLEGIRHHYSLRQTSHVGEERAIAPEMLAATASWAIYGAAKEWVQMPQRAPSDTAAEVILGLVSPILDAAQESAS